MRQYAITGPDGEIISDTVRGDRVGAILRARVDHGKSWEDLQSAGFDVVPVRVVPDTE